jgi:biopolymer transport protein ExbB
MTRHFLLALSFALLLGNSAQAWWNPDWATRKKITIDAGDTGNPITSPIGGATILVRLHDGNFTFTNAKDDGSDIRFVAADDKTVLPSQVEKYDSLLNEAFVWVKVPEIKPDAATTVWLYSGNPEAKPDKLADKPPYDAETTLVYHFASGGVPAVDSSGQKNNAETAGTASEGALIGGGLRLLGDKPIVIPATPTLAVAAGEAFTWSAWVKQTVAQPDAILFDRQDGANGLRIGVANGTPYVVVKGAGGTQRVAATTPLALNTWTNLAVVAKENTLTIYVSGKSAGVLNVALSALNSPANLGAGPGGPVPGFVGEIDELQISRAARAEGAIELAAVGQAGGAGAEKLIQIGEDEASGGGHDELQKHLSLLGEIAKNLTVDGWVVIFLCIALAIVGWGVAIQKLVYLSQLKKGNDEFMKRWSHLSGDLTVLDHNDAESIRSLGGSATPKAQRFMRASPIYHIYHIGADEIRKRIERSQGGFTGLSNRSIQAIKASLDTGLVHGVHKLNSHLVFLTIGIAGGPYLGLLGTVIGVMITFAVIAQSGEVEINSIAPGIAGALLATVAGLAVAIPALFIYSYLSSRIKEVIGNMQTFIDEFITKIAESYPKKD